MISPVPETFNKSILTLISLIVLFHSMSIYAAQTTVAEEISQVEATQEAEDQGLQLRAYDALIPTFHSMAPLVLYLIHEVVLLSEAKYQEMPSPNYYENHFLNVLFPLIISPNAP
jgi:hypothetical protein